MQANIIKVLIVCVSIFWSFVPAKSTGLLQAALVKDEPPTFVTWPENGLGLSITYLASTKTLTRSTLTVAAISQPHIPKRD